MNKYLLTLYANVYCYFTSSQGKKIVLCFDRLVFVSFKLFFHHTDDNTNFLKNNWLTIKKFTGQTKQIKWSKIYANLQNAKYCSNTNLQSTLQIPYKYSIG